MARQRRNPLALDNPKISIVIPVYNEKATIDEILRRVLDTEIRKEVIIVDDCSTDDTVKKISEISCSIPIVFKQLECNSGGGFARNAGIRLASGNYLAFLDSDDEWDREHLRTLAQHTFQSDESFVVASSALVSETKRILNALALAYNNKALYDKALQLHFKSLEIREKEGNKKEISTALNNIGLVYYKIGNFEQALDFFLQAIPPKLESKTTDGLDLIYVNVGLSYAYLGNAEESIQYVNKSYETCDKNCTDEVVMQGEFCLGLSYWNKREFVPAREHFTSSYLLSKKLGLGDVITSEGALSQSAVMKRSKEAHGLLLLGRPPAMKGYELFAAAKLFGYLKAGQPILGVLPHDEAWQILQRLGVSTIADVESVVDIVAALRQFLRNWSNGCLRSLIPEANACRAFSAERQTQTLVSALEGTPAVEPFVPGHVKIPDSLREEISRRELLSKRKAMATLPRAENSFCRPANSSTAITARSNNNIN